MKAYIYTLHLVEYISCQNKLQDQKFTSSVIYIKYTKSQKKTNKQIFLKFLKNYPLQLTETVNKMISLHFVYCVLPSDLAGVCLYFFHCVQPVLCTLTPLYMCVVFAALPVHSC